MNSSSTTRTSLKSGDVSSLANRASSRGITNNLGANLLPLFQEYQRGFPIHPDLFLFRGGAVFNEGAESFKGLLVFLFELRNLARPLRNLLINVIHQNR